ncbi:MAG: Pyrroline-5-carboxylate reductase [Verrucomicrobiae bacterium]|nr:Pyrroline-5-carboxylate reductase [Verrucomicrobiae bacterium]
MNLPNKTLAFIGAGNMAEALIRGLLVNKVLPGQQIIATDVRADRLEFLAKSYSIRTSQDNAAASREADIIILAVKPQHMSLALASLAIQPTALIISIAAGITTARIEKELAGTARVIRVMPNTPALVGAGAAALALGARATPADLEIAEGILNAVGTTVRVEEKLLDAVTALSGSGPAYVFLVAEALIKAGIEQGLPADIARKLAIHTIFGAAVLLAESTDEPAELRRKVTSPGGTTAAALKVFEDRHLTAIFAAALDAAARRSRELSAA